MAERKCFHAKCLWHDKNRREPDGAEGLNLLPRLYVLAIAFSEGTMRARAPERARAWDPLLVFSEKMEGLQNVVGS